MGMSEDESQLMTSLAGTPCYIAPDVYSFGVTMAVTMLGDRICRCADIGGRTVMMPNNMIQEMPDKLELLPVPPRAVISSSIVEVLGERPTAAELLTYEFFTDGVQ